MIGSLKHVDKLSDVPDTHIFIEMTADENQAECLCTGEMMSLRDIVIHTEDWTPVFPCDDCLEVFRRIDKDAEKLKGETRGYQR